MTSPAEHQRDPLHGITNFQFKKMKKLVLATLLLAAGCFCGFGNDLAGADAVFSSAFANHSSNIQVQGSGQVIKVLSDDNDGSRHQRFIVRLASGQTLLVAHNIDVAARVASIKVGDSIGFSGEYEWNPQGGVIHWTHHDPQGRHTAGWIKHNGRTYQ